MRHNPFNTRSGNTVAVEKKLLKSPAYRRLSGTAKTVLTDFMMKKRVKKHNARWEIINNGEIQYTYTEAEQNGISRRAFSRAIDALIESGFLDITETGAGVCRLPTKYAISDRWKNWGSDSFVTRSRSKRRRWKATHGFQKGHPYYPPNV
jgi:hypothetical protein